MHKKFFYIECLIFSCLSFFGAEEAYARSTTKYYTVVIDAGHGGHDPGAIGRRGKEKNINLNVALKLGSYIENNCKDTKVIYTRQKDKFIPLHRRASIANDAKADLFISIHTNSLAKRNARVSGTETYTLGLHKTKENLEVAQKENAVILIEDDYKQQYAGFNPNSAESYIIFEFMQDKNMSQSVSFASEIQKQFKNNRRTDRGVHQAGFLVLRATTMPSVLVELGYISNPNEEEYLLSERGTTTLAKSIYNAFLSYKRQEYDTKAVHSQVYPSATEANDYIGEATRRQTQHVSTTTKPTKEISHTPKVSTEANKDQTLQKPVFKIQILTSGKLLPNRSKLFKGLSPVGHYKEKGIYKYTFGSDTNYNKIRRLKRDQTDKKFKDAFIIAFKNGEKMDVNQAIREFKQNR